MLSFSTLFVILTGGGIASLAALGWVWYNRNYKQGAELGEVREQLKQAREALDNIKKVIAARDSIERTLSDPDRLRDDDGFRRD